jgi:streptomycin 6-kinase
MMSIKGKETSCPVVTRPKSKSRASLSPIHTSEDMKVQEPLMKHDSTSSAVTVVRQNSGHGNEVEFKRASHSKRLDAVMSSGTGEAMTAAMRAMATASGSKLPRQ